MRLTSRKTKAALAAGLVVALGCVAPTRTALASSMRSQDDKSHVAPALLSQASSTVYVDPSASSEADTYASIGDALNSVTDGGTIKLRKDVSLNLGVNIDKDVLLDLNGHSISGSSCIWINADHSMTVDGGGSIQSTHWHVFIVAGKLVAKNCTIVGMQTHNLDAAIRCDNELIIDGASITTTHGQCVYSYSGKGSISFISGSLNSPPGTEAILLRADDKSKVSISGGTFSSPVPAAWCAAGYAPRLVDPDDETAGYTVGKAIPKPTATDCVYNGSHQYGTEAAEGFSLSGGGKDAGSHTTTAVLKDGYAWEPASTDDTTDAKVLSQQGAAPVVLTWSMAPKQLLSSMVKAPKQTYDGSPKTPVVVVDDKTTLVEGIDYCISYANNTNVGTASYRLVGIGNYEGVLEDTFEIVEIVVPRRTRSSNAGSKTKAHRVVRLWGENRFETMGAVVNEGFKTSKWAVLVSASNYPDALCASGLAGAYDCPVFLTDPYGLSPEVAAQLARLGVSNVLVMGGAAAISELVESELDELGYDVTRVGGDDRVVTSVVAFDLLRSVDDGSDTVVVATGFCFADALSIGPWSYATKSPVLLVDANGILAEQEVNAIVADGGIRRVVFLGGDAAVSDNVRAQLGDAFEYERLGGADRYETSRTIAEFGVANGLSYRSATVATGRSFVDALMGAAFAGNNGSVLVIADEPADGTVDLIRSHRDEVTKAYVLGGPAAVSDETLAALE